MIHKSLIFFLSFLPIVISAQQAVFDWAQSCGNPPNTTDTRTCLAPGPNGSFVMAGEFLDKASFGDNTLTSLGGTDIFVAWYSSTGDVISAEQIGGTDYDFIRDVKADGTGNTYLLGYFYGSIQLGSNLFTSYGSQDIFLAKMDDAGQVSWSCQVGGSMADYPTGIALDSDGHILLTGHFYDVISIGDTTLSTLASSDVYLARFDSEGQFMNVVQAGGSSSDQLSSLAVDPEHNITLVGSFYDDFTIGDTTFTTDDPVGIFVAGFTPGMELAWAFQLQGSYLNTGVLAAAGQDGSIYLAGSFSEEIHFGSETFSAGEFNQDLFLVKYTGSGLLQWARHGHSRSSDDVTGLGVDGNDNVYLTGHFLDSLHFDWLMLPYTLCCGSREVYIVNYTSDGRPWWGEQVSGARTTHQSMTVSSEDLVLLSGIFSEDVVFGDDTLSYFDGYRNFITGLSGDIYTTIFRAAATCPMTIFPNPASDMIRIYCHEKITLTEVYTMQGALVERIEGDDIRTVSVSGVAPGCILVRVVSDSGASMTQKVMVAN